MKLWERYPGQPGTEEEETKPKTREEESTGSEWRAVDGLDTGVWACRVVFEYGRWGWVTPYIDNGRREWGISGGVEI